MVLPWNFEALQQLLKSEGQTEARESTTYNVLSYNLQRPPEIHWHLATEASTFRNVTWAAARH